MPLLSGGCEVSAKVRKTLVFVLFCFLMLFGVVFALEVGSAEKFTVKNVYEQKLVPVYDYRVVLDKISYYSEVNDSWSDEVSHKQKYVSSYKAVDTDKRIGIDLTSKLTQFKTEYRGYVNAKDGFLYRWKYEVGDRNFEDDKYGRCLDYEITKGVCESVKV